ncbi:disease resistance protein Pik-1-like isoform X2 [Pistacia vera]|uniref:disease resistance protein Pik-1-like isoform X2 n=1 Tax=Pistacia vera TaxID=55513 RepID=UPI0012637944|nr:disease resistance protein Pik-1-like isoform X2 [Pistacia vera]
MKQKMVINVPMHNDKDRCKAKKIVGGISVTLKGEDLRQIEVIGVGVDAATITTKLRKKVGHAELVTVAPADDHKKPPVNEAKPDPDPVRHPDICGMPDYQMVPVYRNYQYYQDYPTCSIL